MISWGPFLVDGRCFEPFVYLDRVDLPDFGCEGRPDSQPAFGAIWGRRPDGTHFWRVTEAALLESGFTDDQWLGVRNGKMILVAAQSLQWQTARRGEALEAVLHTNGVE